MAAFVEIPQITCVLENRRTKFSLCRWSTAKDLKFWPLPIPEGVGEIYFQYFVQVHEKLYYAWGLEEEAFLEKGHRIEYNDDFSVKSCEEIAPMPEKYMRPTAVVEKVGQKHRIFMIGGHKELHNLVYEPESNTWQYLPLLPQGHNVTTNVCVNYNNEAIFTCILDARMNLKMACLELTELNTYPTKEGLTQAMYWTMKKTAEEHKIDRFHVKGAVVMSDGRIAVTARGRTEGMKQ